ncbi:Isoprenyl transferase [Thalictrum thalictroides]|uniref:Alkyl transferase n=1 Tax=Thalictrum thalictroides TaxID=46969 RepID=A0A7J6VJQ6_THATH|nr:Isoprenyl transferase [Thalictrum thalictroides]
MLTLRLSFPIPLTNNNNTRISLHKSKPISSISQTKLHFTTISTKPSKSRQFVSAVITSGIEQLVEETSVSNGNDLMGVEELLPLGIKREFMPNHVAVIMDGNVRWARKRGWPSSLGHEAGVSALRKLIELCCKWGIRVLTVFAFSFDNWNRPKMEVDFLMSLFERGIEAEVDNFIREDIRVSIIGDSSKLPDSLQKMIANTEEVTNNNLGLQLIVAVSYTGKYDIVQACQNIAYKVKDGLVQPEEINEHLIEQELQTNCTEFPYPDLLIRTSGELRVSNFLLWQLAYTELCFVESLWPDFGEADFIEALHSFQHRQRRYGRRDL